MWPLTRYMARDFGDFTPISPLMVDTEVIFGLIYMRLSGCCCVLAALLLRSLSLSHTLSNYQKKKKCS